MSASGWVELSARAARPYRRRSRRSRLDRHVAMVRNKLALGRFVSAVAWTSVIWAGAVWLGLVIDRLFRVRPIGARWWIWGGLAACAVVAMVYALIKRPSQHD